MVPVPSILSADSCAHLLHLRTLAKTPFPLHSWTKAKKSPTHGRQRLGYQCLASESAHALFDLAPTFREMASFQIPLTANSPCLSAPAFILLLVCA